MSTLPVTSMSEPRAATFPARRFVVAGVVALGANVIAHVIGDAADASWDVAQPYSISIWAVLAATIAVFVIGGAVVRLVARRRPRSRRIFGWVGLAVGLLSMVSLVNAADLATALCLGSMHVITAIAWALALLTGKDA